MSHAVPSPRSTPILMVIGLLGPTGLAYGHTRLQTPTINEGMTVYNASVIGHGCHDPRSHDNGLPVIATSIVFPDGADSSITVRPSNAGPEAQATPYQGTLQDFVPNWGNVPQLIYSNDVFSQEQEKLDALGNVVGISATGGKLPGTVHGLVPFKTDPVIIEPTSCVHSVSFVLAIADICKTTGTGKFDDSAANLWTPEVGSQFHGIAGISHGYNSPAALKVLRTSPLPETCKGIGLDVTVTPSAAQINRDLPIMIGKRQFWPKR